MIQENASMEGMASDSSTEASAFALSIPSSGKSTFPCSVLASIHFTWVQDLGLSHSAAGQCGSTSLSWVPTGVPLEDESEPGLSSHTALSMATTSSGRLAFAHSVMPMISDIGRQLAAQYAVGFEHGRVRSAQLNSGELEELEQPFEVSNS